MQRSNVPITVSAWTAPQDRMLYQIKQKLELSYWANNEGVFQIQFLSDNAPLTNLNSPQQLQVIRFTPDIMEYEAFQTIIPGRLNNDGSIEYGGGRLGMLTSKGIQWKDGAVWVPVQSVPPRRPDIMNLRQIQKQAYLDSKVLMGEVYTRNYLY
jgi:hypothetical protein